MWVAREKESAWLRSPVWLRLRTLEQIPISVRAVEDSRKPPQLSHPTVTFRAIRMTLRASMCSLQEDLWLNLAFGPWRLNLTNCQKLTPLRFQKSQRKNLWSNTTARWLKTTIKQIYKRTIKLNSFRLATKLLTKSTTQSAIPNLKACQLSSSSFRMEKLTRLLQTRHSLFKNLKSWTQTIIKLSR